MQNVWNPVTSAARLAVCVGMIGLAGCSASPTAPSIFQQPAAPVADAVTISGQVYASVGPMYPHIENAVVEVNVADGSSASVTSDAHGFYQISTRPGSITVTTSKDGFETKQMQFDVSRDTVLNFSLDPR